MLFGLTGAHRSGKTTLARTVARELDIEFYETSTSEVARKLGFDAVGVMTLSQRLQLQQGLLENHLNEISRRSRPLITDRTPLDYMGYMLCEVDMQSHLKLTEEELFALGEFMVNCLEKMRENFDYAFYTQPLPEYDIADGKPAANPAYQLHHDICVLGALAKLSGSINIAHLNTANFETRRSFLHDTIVSRLDEIDTERKSASYLC